METTETIRDLVIIMVALGSLLLYVLLGILAWQIWRLTKLIQTEIKPLLNDAQETLNTVRSTANFMSDNVVAPTTQAVSKATGARRTASVLLNELLPGKNRPRN